MPATMLNYRLRSLGALFSALLFFNISVQSQIKGNEKIDFCLFFEEDSVIAYHYDLLSNGHRYSDFDIEALLKIKNIYSYGAARKFLSYKSFYRNEHKKGFHYFKEYCTIGGELRHYLYDNDSLLKSITDSLTVIYDSTRKQYLTSLDSSKLLFVSKLVSDDQSVRNSFNSAENESAKSQILKKMRFTDSINQHKLDSLVSKSGWPKRQQLGFGSFSPNPDIIVIHATLAIKLSYYQIVKESFQNNEEYARTLASIAVQTFFRHREFGYSKLRFVKITEKNCDCEDIFILKTLSNFCQDNNVKIGIRILANEHLRINFEQHVKKNLIKFGLSESDVYIIEEELPEDIQVGVDQFGSYDLVFKLSR